MKIWERRGFLKRGSGVLDKIPKMGTVGSPETYTLVTGSKGVERVNSGVLD